MKAFPPFWTVIFLLASAISSEAQWNTDISVNTQLSFSTTESAVPYTVTHPGGLSYISWFSPGPSGYYYPWIQQVDAQGYIQWAASGLQVSDHPSMTWITDYDLAVCPDTSVLIAFQDTRNGPNDVFIYKISRNGEFLWGNDGIELSDEPNFEANPVMAVHADNSVTVAWPRYVDAGAGFVVLQRLDANGNKQWTDKVLGEAGYDYDSPRVIPVENGNTILIWYKEWGPYWAPNRNILAQKYAPDGTALWASPASLFTGAIPVYVEPVVAVDGSGGAYVTWMYEKTANKLSTFIQHVDGNGSVTMPSGGVEVSGNSNLHLEPAMGCDITTGSAYVFWRESNTNQTQFGLYGQKIESDGTLGWGSSGKMIVGLSSQNAILINVNGLPGGVVASYLYEDPGSMTELKVKAVRLDETGNLVWGSILDVSTCPSGKGYLNASDYQNGQFIFTWNDDRLGHAEIFGQNLSETGIPGPMTWPMEVFPDTLWFLTPESFEGLPFYIRNPNGYALDVQYIQQMGFVQPNCVPWFIDPYISFFPVTIAPGDTLGETVRWLAVDGLLGAPNGFDTLNIYTLTDTARIIIAVDTLYIWLGNGETEGNALSCSLYPNPADCQTILTYRTTTPGISEIRILDLAGRVVREWHENQAAGKNEFGISTADLKNGSYLVTVKTGGLMAKKLLIVAHGR